MLELLKNEVSVPQHLYDDLNSARRLVNTYRNEPAELDIVMDNSPLLKLVEMNLLTLAETELGKDSAEEWQKKINMAYEDNSGLDVKRSTFVAGVPKGEYWIRLKASEVKLDGGLDDLIAKYNLVTKPQDDDYLLIYGNKEDVKAFLKEVRQKVVEQN